MKDSQQGRILTARQIKYIKANNERFSTRIAVSAGAA